MSVVIFISALGDLQVLIVLQPHEVFYCSFLSSWINSFGIPLAYEKVQTAQRWRRRWTLVNGLPVRITAWVSLFLYCSVPFPLVLQWFPNLGHNQHQLIQMVYNYKSFQVQYRVLCEEQTSYLL